MPRCRQTSVDALRVGVRLTEPRAPQRVVPAVRRVDRMDMQVAPGRLDHLYRTAACFPTRRPLPPPNCNRIVDRSSYRAFGRLRGDDGPPFSPRPSCSSGSQPSGVRGCESCEPPRPRAVRARSGSGVAASLDSGEVFLNLALAGLELHHGRVHGVHGFFSLPSAFVPDGSRSPSVLHRQFCRIALPNRGRRDGTVRRSGRDQRSPFFSAK